jgi:hypothetical protein
MCASNRIRALRTLTFHVIGTTPPGGKRTSILAVKCVHRIESEHFALSLFPLSPLLLSISVKCVHRIESEHFALSPFTAPLFLSFRLRLSNTYFQFISLAPISLPWIVEVATCQNLVAREPSSRAARSRRVASYATRLSFKMMFFICLYSVGFHTISDCQLSNFTSSTFYNFNRSQH